MESKKKIWGVCAKQTFFLEIVASIKLFSLIFFTVSYAGAAIIIPFNLGSFLPILTRLFISILISEVVTNGLTPSCIETILQFEGIFCSALIFINCLLIFLFSLVPFPAAVIIAAIICLNI